MPSVSVFKVGMVGPGLVRNILLPLVIAASVILMSNNSSRAESADEKIIRLQSVADAGSGDDVWALVYELTKMGNMRNLSDEQLDERWRMISFYIVKAAKMGNRHAIGSMETARYNSGYVDKANAYFSQDRDAYSYSDFIASLPRSSISGNDFAHALARYMVSKSCSGEELAKFAGRNGNVVVSLFASVPGTVTRYEETCGIESMGRRMVFGISTAHDLRCSEEDSGPVSCTATIGFTCQAEVLETLRGSSAVPMATEQSATDQLACGEIRAASLPVAAVLQKIGGRYEVLGVLDQP